MGRSFRLGRGLAALRASTSIRWGAVGFLVTVMLGGTALSRQAQAVEDPTAAAISNGLQSFSDAASGLAGLEELASAIPFTDDLPTGDDGLRLAQVFAQSLRDRLAAETFESIDELDQFLDDPDGANGAADDGTYGGVQVDITGTITPGPAGTYDIALSATLHRDGTTPIAIDTPALDVNGGALSTDFDLATNLTFRIDPALPAATGFSLLTTTAPTMSVGFDADAAFTGPDSFEINVGLTQVDVGGTADLGADLTATWVDPTPDGKITRDDWTSTAPLDLFDVSYSASHANLAMTLTSGLSGLGSVTGTVNLADSDISTLATPTVSLGSLADFTNMTPQNFLSGLASIAGALVALDDSGPANLQLPLLQQSLGEKLALGEKIQDFLVDNHLSDPSAPLTLGPGPSGAVVDTPEEYDAVVANFDTVQEIAAALASALGVSQSALGFAYDTAGQRLTLNVDYGANPSPTTVAIDLAGELERVGVVDVEDLSSAVTLDPAYDIDFGVSVDLSPPAAGETPLQLFSFDTAGQEITADAPVDADINVVGKIGFLGLGLQDTTAGPVRIVGPAVSGTPMLSVNIDGGADNLLPVGDLLTLLVSPNFTAAGIGSITPSVNVAVPSFTLEATAGASGTTLATGTLTVEWPDITVPGSHPTVAANADFSDLLSFDFDHANPLQLFNQVLDAVQALTTQVDQLAGSNSLLSTDLPIAGKSFDDVANQLQQVTESVNTLVANPSATIQNLESELETGISNALGITDAARQAQVIDISMAPGTPTTLLVSLSFGLCSVDGPGCSKVTGPIAVPINLGLGDGLGGVVGAGGTGNINLNYAAKTDFDFGVELPTVTQGAGFSDVPTASGPASPFILDTSNLSLTASVEADGNYGVAIGPLTLSVGKTDGTDNAKAKVGASFVLDHDEGAAGPTRMPLSSPALSNWVSNLPPSDISPTPKLTCDGVAGGPYDACAKLPVYLGSDLLGTITFSLAELETPGTFTLAGHEAVLAALLARGLDWTLVLQGMQQLLATLQQSLDGASFGQSLPIVGDGLDAGADIAQKFQDHVVTPLNNLATEMQTQTEPSQVRTKLNDFLTTALGSLLVARPADDIEITMLCNDGNNDPLLGDLAAGMTPCSDASHDAIHVADVQVAFTIGETAATGDPINFDIGMPGLRLGMRDDPATPADNLTASLDWQIDLAFGLNVNESFYLVSNNPSPAPGVPAGSPEIRVGAQLDLPSAPLEGDVAFIPFSATDNDSGGAPPDLDLDLALDFRGGGADNRLSMSELLNGLDPDAAPDFGATISGGVHLALDIVTGALDGETSALPTFKTLFRLDWDFGAGENLQSDLSTGDLTIAFENVRVDLGSLLGGFLKPILGEAQKLTRPLQPVIDIVTAPIPGVTDLARVVGCPTLPIPPTMTSLNTCELSLLRLYELQNAELTMIRRLIQLIEFINTADGSQNPNYQLGSFTVVSSAARGGPLSANQKEQLLGTAQGPGGPGSPIANALEGLTGAIASKVSASKTTGGFTFPAFDDPSRLFKMLLGKDVTLIHFDAGNLEASVTIPIELGPPIGPIPISVGITIQLGIRGHFAVGYDTKGIRKAVEVLTNDDPSDDGLFNLVASLFQGIGIDDRLRVDGEPTGEDIPEITLFGSVTAKAALDILIAEAGIRGGVAAELRANLHDGGFPHGSEKPENLDGVLRIDEIISVLSNPLCLFDLDGEITAFLEAYVDTLIGGEEFPIVGPVTLLRFDDLGAECLETPKLAHVEPGGRLVLHMGPFASSRDFREGETREKFIVRQLDEAGTKFSVSAFGYQEEWSGVSSIFADGGSDNDVIQMLPGSANANAEAGAIDNNLISFTRGVTVCGGGGADIIASGDGDDTLVGDGGNAGFACTTTEAGTDGNDDIAGGGGGDTITGLGGADRLSGDFGNDNLSGGGGNDFVSGGPGADRAAGGANDDHVNGGPGSDPTVPAPPGTDPAVVAAGRDGADVLMGGTGQDDVQGGPGEDFLYGEDELTGTVAEKCAVDGGSAAADGDNLDGGLDADMVFGGSGPDTAAGGPGGDKVCGNGGRDNLNGEGGTTTTAPGGNDYVDGGADRDDVSGGTANDVVRGGAAADVVDGGAGDDDVTGGAGRDLLRGAGGADIVVGDSATITGSGPDGIAARPGSLAGSAALVTGVGTASDSSLPDCAATPSDDTGTSDCLYGGGGGDVLFGEGGRDRMFGDGSDDWLAGGTQADEMRGGNNNDTMLGQPGDDDMNGDSGNDDMQGNEGVDLMRGGLDADCMQGNEEGDTLHGDDGDDRMAGGSAVAGAADGADTMYGSTGNDRMAGDNAVVCGGDFTLLDVPFVGAVVDGGASGADTLYGGDHDDTIYGQSKNDPTLSGDGGDDRIEGNAGEETIYGGSGQDDLVGGSGWDQSAGTIRKLANVADGGDELHGGTGIDYLAGDNAAIMRVPGPSLYDPAGAGRFVELFEVQKVGALPPSASTYADDDLLGEDGNDAMFGQGAGDRINGGPGDDSAEGNAGADEIKGDAGRDNLIGGGSANNGFISTDSSGDGLLDEGDTIYGELDASLGAALADGGDAIAGDNARITNLADGTGLPGLGRQVVLFDTELAGGPAVLGDVHGPETLYGNGGDDFVFGQGDTDTVHGGLGDDYGEGNAGADLMLGEPGEDDLAGGGSAADGVIDADRDGTGLLDLGDRLYGGGQADVLTGDNARIDRTRAADGIAWLPDVITQGHHREVNLFDTARTAPASVSGNDLLLGGDQRDRIFGQGANDTAKGNGDDDFVEGNQASDLVEGNDGEDDLIGGSRTSAYLDDSDVIHGGGGADVAIGDNGIIDREDRSPAGGYYYRTYQIGITSSRFIQLLDIDSADADVAGSDQVSGGSGVDALFGQAERDYLMGGSEDDYMEGNGGSDFEFGDLVRADVSSSPPAQMSGGLPGLASGLPLEDPADTTPESPEPQLSGTPGSPGQDDIIGGSSKVDLLDGGDFQYGNGAADFITGDNGTIRRTIDGSDYVRFVDDNPTTAVRRVTRFCPATTSTCELAGRSGGDYQEGNGGDDYLWGQDGDDTQFGNADGDDIIGELGDDTQYGGTGEDAMVGDRGRITNTTLSDNSRKISFDTNGPAFFKYTGLIAGQRDRRVSLTDDGDGAPFPLMGVDTGGNDRMRGGPGHDSMHGAAADDLMNGDSNGDWLFGDDGQDAMWGGRGCNPAVDTASDCTTDVSRGENDRYVDYLFGGWGGSQADEVAAADFLDWLPRGTSLTCNDIPADSYDPCSWFSMTAPEAAADEPVYYQHFQGIDWMYGGQDRDAMMANVGKNGPDGGDRMIDWKGNFNLYTMCWASYGGDNAIRSQSPAMHTLLQNVAYGSGAGGSLSEVQTEGTSAYRELALVYPGPGNNGPPFPDSPGHFASHPCEPTAPPRDK